jgi:hypothetical protein
VFASPHVPLSPPLAAYGKRAIRPGRPLLAGVTDLMHAIREDFRYVQDSTDLTHTRHPAARGTQRRVPGLRSPHDRVSCARWACRRAT